MSSSTDNNPNSKDTEMMSVLERQRSIYAGLYHQQQSMQNNISNIQTPLHQLSLPVNGNNGLLNEHFHNFAAFGGENYGISCSDMSKNSLETENFMVPTVSNSSSAPIRNLVAQDSIKACKEKPISAKKRKAEEVDIEEELKAEAGESQSEITMRSDTSKASGDDKSDYIHVRARRGQATDSHSLAERARREKISKKMKYLQDLVPGCNKVTGKAGMLDEIINYVQSLQKQVEFLSLKLSTVPPRLDFNVDNLFSKEIPTYRASFPNSTMPLEMATFAQFQLNEQQQISTSSGVNAILNGAQMIPPKRETSSLPNSEAYLDSSCFEQIQQLPNWDTDLTSLFPNFH
ncbi:hypothetical protein LIER_16906 [Lithospermum erythrorhizon]|uniref:BHLH domain-containing protein n=1 Tax=Lithospermum erythrorhizon TaxID=34254 RepID=A0AAV3QCI0_LITER